MQQWFAHRVQRPGEKINHALVLGGDQGIGKDAIDRALKARCRYLELRRDIAAGGVGQSSTNFDNRWSCASLRAKTLAISTASPSTMAPRR